MKAPSYIFNSNPAFVEELYQKYKTDPAGVDANWQRFFEGYEFGDSRSALPVESMASSKEVAVVKLINGYRSRAHLLADTNPVRERRKHKADLELSYFGLTEEDLDAEFDAGAEIELGRTSLRNILERLKKIYCGHIGAEFMYCRDENLRQWLYREMEPIANSPTFSVDEKRHILQKIDQSVAFESFLQMKYVGQKRFSLEGLESLIPSLDSAVRQGAELGVKEFVLGMAHRGRLNVLVNIFGKSYANVFSEFEGAFFPEASNWGGDVKYHLGWSSDVKTANGFDVHLSLVPNPSHLEAVNPVVAGIVRAKMGEFYNGDSRKILPVLIHGDAAIAGQGVNYELINMSTLEGYEVGGTVHIVLNNQVGFTANYKEGRSSVYCTDLAKVMECPVFHVNADDPLAVVHAVKMAIKIRQEFGIDVFVDILGYRRYGHNEGDEPRFTQPILYRAIQQHPSIDRVFMNQLTADGVITETQVTDMTRQFRETLQERLQYVKTQKTTSEISYFGRHWQGLRLPTEKDFEKSVETGFDKTQLKKIAEALTQVPKEFHLFTKMKKLLEDRRAFFFDKKQVDWGLAELLAYGTLLLDGFHVRLSGQDSQRGTFSHRHAVIKDEQSEDLYVQLQHLAPKQPRFEVYNSHLSEYCVLGFEFGFSIAMPKAMVIWEAQFGDFANGAQITIDQFISSSATKWQRMSGLTLFLPHGYEGQGPEHSNARPERYLQLCAENNMYVVNATTPANFFHLLRRQMRNEFRMPLIVMTPKSLLRHPLVVSDVAELEKGRFQEVLDDTLDEKKVKRVLLCSGKVYYDLLEKREKEKRTDVALVRLEQLYPLPKKQLDALRKKYAHVKDWVWCQEEPANMGGWVHILSHLPEFGFRLVSRDESASTASGSSKKHELTRGILLDRAFEWKEKKA